VDKKLFGELVESMKQMNGVTWMKCSSTWETTRHRRTGQSHDTINLVGFVAEKIFSDRPARPIPKSNRLARLLLM